MKYAFEVGLLVAANVIVYHASLRFMDSNIKKGGGWLNCLFSRYCRRQLSRLGYFAKRRLNERGEGKYEEISHKQ